MYSALQTRRPPAALAGMPMLGLGDASSALIGSAMSSGVSLATGAVNTWLNQINLAHQADTATTQIVNGLEPLLNQNKNAYLAGPGTCQDQAAAEGAFLSAYQWLISPQGCGNGAYGSAGNRCISDRFGGGGATDPSGAKFPWPTWYYQPIADDPRASGCAAQLAASNPEAGSQSAEQNIMNLISGSGVQTTAGEFAGSGSTGGVSNLSPSTTASTVAGIPLEYLLIGGAALLVLLIVT